MRIIEAPRGWSGWFDTLRMRFLWNRLGNQWASTVSQIWSSTKKDCELCDDAGHSHRTEPAQGDHTQQLHDIPPPGPIPLNTPNKKFFSIILDRRRTRGVRKAATIYSRARWGITQGRPPESSEYCGRCVAEEDATLFPSDLGLPCGNACGDAEAFYKRAGKSISRSSRSRMSHCSLDTSQENPGCKALGSIRLQKSERGVLIPIFLYLFHSIRSDPSRRLLRAQGEGSSFPHSVKRGDACFMSSRNISHKSRKRV